MIDRLRRLLGRRLPTTAVLLGALALGACQTDGNKPVAAKSISGNSISSSNGSAIAFESIDGPPQPVFDRLVANLSTEAGARQMPVVSRQSQAAYRVRGYLAATVENGKGEVDWVWDVFDADRTRVLRVAGVEKLGPGKDVWNKLDDAALQRIAARSLDEISSRLAGGAPTATPAAAPKLDPADAPPVTDGDGPAVAASEPTGDAAGPGDAVAEAAPIRAQPRALTFAAHP